MIRLLLIVGLWVAMILVVGIAVASGPEDRP
jgi:hypothetical protein